MGIEELTPLEALGVAICAESAEGGEVYSELAVRVSNEFLRQKIELLAKEELQHNRILEKMYKKQFPDVTPVLPSSQLPKEISSQTERDQLSVRDTLCCAIEQEQKSRGFYLEAALKGADLTGDAMFNFLADWEFSHQMALSAEYGMGIRYAHDYF
ncbi:MAG: ferritin family protein [Bacteroidota bacterium]